MYLFNRASCPCLRGWLATVSDSYDGNDPSFPKRLALRDLSMYSYNFLRTFLTPPLINSAISSRDSVDCKPTERDVSLAFLILNSPRPLHLRNDLSVRLSMAPPDHLRSSGQCLRSKSISLFPGVLSVLAVGSLRPRPCSASPPIPRSPISSHQTAAGRNGSSRRPPA